MLAALYFLRFLRTKNTSKLHSRTVYTCELIIHISFYDCIVDRAPLQRATRIFCCRILRGEWRICIYLMLAQLSELVKLAVCHPNGVNKHVIIL